MESFGFSRTYISSLSCLIRAFSSFFQIVSRSKIQVKLHLCTHCAWLKYSLHIWPAIISNLIFETSEWPSHPFYISLLSATFDWYSVCYSGTDFCVLNGILYKIWIFFSLWTIFPIPLLFFSFLLLNIMENGKVDWHEWRGHLKRVKQFHLPSLLKKHCWLIQREAECKGHLYTHTARWNLSSLE